MSSRSQPSNDTVVRSIPLAHEELKVGRRRVDAAKVTLKTTTHVDPVVVDETLAADEITVTRTPIGRFIEAPPAPRHEGDVLIIPIIEEVLVVERRLRLVEEVRIERRVVTRPHRQTVELRRQQLEVTRRPAAGARTKATKSATS